MSEWTTLFLAALAPWGMDVAIVTIGDEVLAGDTTNTNAQWVARQLTERGASVKLILTIGDIRETIASHVDDLAAEYDRVIVIGGLGGTHDDVTMEAIANAFDRDLEVDPAVREAVVESSRRFVEANPELAERYDLGLDVDAWAETVAGSRHIENPTGLSPGCVVENVYVLPGVPSELRGTFETIAAEFGGDVVSESRYTDAPEGVLQSHLGDLEEQFDVAVGSYPGEKTDRNRVKVTGEDPEAVAAAVAWLAERIHLEED